MQASTIQTLVPDAPASLHDHVPWGLSDVTCPDCGGPLLAAAGPSGGLPITLICLAGPRLINVSEVPLTEQHLLYDRLRNLVEVGLFEAATGRTHELLRRTAGEAMIRQAVAQGAKQSPKGDRPTRASENVPVPPGFRSVAWLRPNEARVVVEAYERRAPVVATSADGGLIARAEWHEAESEEALLYRAQVRLVRGRKSGEKTVGWIRPEEAEAVIEAERSEQDVDFAHRAYGKGGRVNFFALGSPTATRYRSPTRLLRRV